MLVFCNLTVFTNVSHIMFILDLILSLWRSLAGLVWFSNQNFPKSLSVYIRSNDGKKLSVDLDPKWDIKSVKEVVGPKLGLEAEEIKIILAGKELDDSIILEEIDLGEQSTVYCVPLNHKGKTKQKSVNKILVNLPEEEVVTFHVACSHCNGVKHGKLRVRCSECKSGAITVDRDPASWSDVLNPSVISGHCEEQGCVAGPVAWCEFYFRCKEHVSADDIAIPLPLIHANLHSIPCLACNDVRDPVVVFECTDRHTICLECFGRYASIRLRERSFVFSPQHGYTLACPAGCDGSFITEPHHFRILVQTEYEMYQRFAAEECVLQGGGVLCPRPGCGAGIFPDEDCNRVACQCGYVFCKRCLEGFHIGECGERDIAAEGGTSGGYSVDPARAAQARWDEASKRTIKVSTKPCPKCRIPTERDGGCMHMLCARCTFEWCWVCQTEWTRDCMGSHWFG